MRDIDKVAIFVEVINAGSFAEAARKLGKPANSISRYVQELEAQLGIRLLQRTTRKLTLTMAGMAYYEQCAPAIKSILQASAKIKEESEEISGIVRFSAPSDFFDFFQLSWIEEFLSTYPAVHLQCDLNDSLVDLIDGKIDLAVRAGFTPDPTLVARRLAKFHMALAASPAYIKKYGMPDNMHALADHQCIIQAKQTTLELWQLHGPDGPENRQVSGHFSANTTKVRLNACHAGLGIALLPSPLIYHHAVTGKLVEVLPQYKSVGMTVSLVYVSRRHLPKAVTALLNFIVEKHANLDSVFDN